MQQKPSTCFESLCKDGEKTLDSSETLTYDVWVEEALRTVISRALVQIAETGLPGDHHFYVTFLTQDDGVEIPGYLRAQHPNDMTIVLQHQFDDLIVDEDHFEVTLSFNGKSERLVIPFAAVVAFADPSVNFGLQLKMPHGLLDDEEDDLDLSETALDLSLEEMAESIGDDVTELLFSENEAENEDASEDDEPREAEVIALDAFRKK